MKTIFRILMLLCCIFFIVVASLKAANADLPQYADHNEAGFYFVIALIFGVVSLAMKMDSK